MKTIILDTPSQFSLGEQLGLHKSIICWKLVANLSEIWMGVENNFGDKQTAVLSRRRQIT